MPFGIFELWQCKNSPLKNTPKKYYYFQKSSLKEGEGEEAWWHLELQLGLAVCDATFSSKSDQICDSVSFKGKPFHSGS